MGDLSGIPVRLYENGELRDWRSVARLPRDPMEPDREAVLALEGPVAYYVTPRFLCYGVVNAGAWKVVFGPTAQVLPEDPALRELAFQADVPREEVPAFLDGMKALARLPLETLLKLLCAVNYTLSGQQLELQDLAIHDAQQTRIKQTVELRRTKQRFDGEAQPAHNTLQTEETMMRMIQTGDTAALRQWVRQAPAVRGGVLAADQLRQLKNTFIVTATLVSRAALRGGMDPDGALTLSDAYIRRAEQLRTQGELLELQYQMVLEYTEQVERVRLGANPTRLSIDVANYVRRHLSEPISTQAMADEFYLNRTYLAAKFKKETGRTLTEFILNEKTEEAKRLLRYSDKSFSAISSYLGFSSQSHFSRVFKKYAGRSPGDYREAHSR